MINSSILQNACPIEVCGEAGDCLSISGGKFLFHALGIWPEPRVLSRLL